MRRKLRNHAPGFKAKVALAALSGEGALAGSAERFDVHSNQVKQQLSSTCGAIPKIARGDALT